jgi:hypothetical protein
LDKYLERPDVLINVPMLDFFRKYTDRCTRKAAATYVDRRSKMVQERSASHESLVRWYPCLNELDGGAYYRQQLMLRIPFNSLEQLEVWKTKTYRTTYLELVLNVQRDECDDVGNADRYLADNIDDFGTFYQELVANTPIESRGALKAGLEYLQKMIPT